MRPSAIRWLPLAVAAGCGPVGTVSALYPVCDVAAQTEVADPTAEVLGLPALTPRLAPVLGTFAVDGEYRYADDPADRFPGAVSLRQAGPAFAEDRVSAGDGEGDATAADLCPDAYRVPLEVAVALSDGVLALTAAVDLDVTALWTGSSGDEWPGEAWLPIDEVASSLPLRDLDRDLDANLATVMVQAEEDGLPLVSVLLGRESNDRGWDAWRFMTLHARPE